MLPHGTPASIPDEAQDFGSKSRTGILSRRRAAALCRSRLLSHGAPASIPDEGQDIGSKSRTGILSRRRAYGALSFEPAYAPALAWRSSFDSRRKPYHGFLSVHFFNKKNGQNWNRTSDTRIFSPLLYRLSYLAIKGRKNRRSVAYLQ
jgi:hypothetical protein